MTPEQVRKLGRILTRERLGLPKTAVISDWRIAETIYPELGLQSSRAIMAWLSGEYPPSEISAKLLTALVRPRR